jgi:hypothetical protein
VVEVAPSTQTVVPNRIKLFGNAGSLGAGAQLTVRARRRLFTCMLWKGDAMSTTQDRESDAIGRAQRNVL